MSKLATGFRLVFAALGLAFLALFMMAPAAAATGPGTYTVTFNYTYRYLNPETEEVRNQSRGRCSVAIDHEKVLIQPSSTEAQLDVVNVTWATSPFHPDEWIVGGESLGSNYMIQRICLDDHPTRQASDIFANLGRVLYVPADHPIYRRLRGNDRLFMDCINAVPYGIKDVSLQVGEMNFDGQKVLAEVTAFTPSYYKAAGKKHGSYEIKKFGGPDPTRKLWVVAILGYTNWQGVLLPTKFSYTEYNSWNLRTEAENLAPLNIVEGELESVAPGADADITPRLAASLAVSDYRVADQCGFDTCVGYTCGPGEWPEVGSEKYKALASEHKSQMLAECPWLAQPLDVFLRWHLGAWQIGGAVLMSLALLTGACFLFKRFF